MFLRSCCSTKYKVREQRIHTVSGNAFMNVSFFSMLHSYHFHLCYAQCKFSSTNASAIFVSARQSHITWVDWKQNNESRSQHTSTSSSSSSFGESPLTQWFQYNIYIYIYNQLTLLCTGETQISLSFSLQGREQQPTSLVIQKKYSFLVMESGWGLV